MMFHGFQIFKYSFLISAFLPLVLRAGVPSVVAGEVAWLADPLATELPALVETPAGPNPKVFYVFDQPVLVKTETGAPNFSAVFTSQAALIAVTAKVSVNWERLAVVVNQQRKAYPQVQVLLAPIFPTKAMYQLFVRPKEGAAKPLGRATENMFPGNEVVVSAQLNATESAALLAELKTGGVLELQYRYPVSIQVGPDVGLQTVPVTSRLVLNGYCKTNPTAFRYAAVLSVGENGCVEGMEAPEPYVAPSQEEVKTLIPELFAKPPVNVPVPNGGPEQELGYDKDLEAFCKISPTHKKCLAYQARKRDLKLYREIGREQFCFLNPESELCKPGAVNP